MNTLDLDNHISMGEFEPETHEIDEAHEEHMEALRREADERLPNVLRDIASDIPEIRRIDYMVTQAN